MGHAIGTLEWIESTQGKLSAGEWWKMLLKVGAAQAALIPDEYLHKFGLKRPRDMNIDMDAIAPPDSDAAKRARALCEQFSDPYLVGHCDRSYLWGRIFGELNGVNPDPELYYVACMMHDMGLTKALGSGHGREGCFTIVSATQCKSLGEDLGWDTERIDRAREAITLHVNAGVEIEYGPEAHLLNLSTALDVTALRLWQIPKDAVQRVLNAVPRLDQNEKLSACWAQEAGEHPGTRAAWLENNVQFSKRIRRARF